MASFDHTLSPSNTKIDLNRTIRPWSPSVTRLHVHQDPNESLLRFDEHNETFLAEDNIKTLRLMIDGISRFLQEIRHDHVNQITTLQSSIREVGEQLKSQRTHSTLEIEKLHQALGSKNLRSRLQGLQNEILNVASQSKLDVSQVMQAIQNCNDLRLARDNDLLQLLQSAVQQTVQPLLQEQLDIKREIRVLRSELSEANARHQEDQVRIRQLVESLEKNREVSKAEILESMKLYRMAETRVQDQLQKQSTDLATLLGEIRHSLVRSPPVGGGSLPITSTELRVADENLQPFSQPSLTTQRVVVPTAVHDYSTPRKSILSTPKIIIPKSVKPSSVVDQSSQLLREDQQPGILRELLPK